MTRPFALGALLGLAWHVYVNWLMGGNLETALSWSGLVAGSVAGVLATKHTIWTRRRNNGRERFLGGLANYYVGMVAYWFVLILLWRIEMCVQSGGWTDSNLRDSLELVIVFFVYGTVVHGFYLIPLCFASRRVVWESARHQMPPRDFAH